MESLARCPAQPHRQVDDQGAATLLARRQTLLGNKTVDLALDGEQNIDAIDRLGRDRRLAEPREIKELAAAECPARSLDDRPPLRLAS